MGDISDSTSGDGAAGRGWLARSWLGRHWRGELPLAKAFWLNGCLVDLAIEFLILWTALLMSPGSGEIAPSWLNVFALVAGLTGMPFYVIGLAQRVPLGPVTVIIVVTLIVVTIWQIVGVWRSAGRYTGWGPAGGRDRNNRSRRIFMIAARAMTIVWGLQLLTLQLI